MKQSKELGEINSSDILKQNAPEPPTSILLMSFNQRPDIASEKCFSLEQPYTPAFFLDYHSLKS